LGWTGILLLLLVASCKTRQKDESPVRKDPVEKLKAHRDATTSFRTAVLKGKADYHDEAKQENISFTYKISIAHDSLILANVSKMGMPVASILVTQDSVLMRLPLTKESIRCGIGKLEELTGMNLGMEDLQDLLVGDMKVPESAEVEGDWYRSEEPSMGKVSYLVGSPHLKLDKLVAKQPNLDREIQLSFGDFKKTNGQWMPYYLELARVSTTANRIYLSHGEVQLDGDEVSFGFRIPEGYVAKPCTAP